MGQIIERVFVSGASGFIGGRLVERLFLDGKTRVRAGIRRWSRAARIGRFPVEIVSVDLLDPSRIGPALEGVDAVVHCAVGSPQVNEEGTANLLEASRKAGICRFVHLSTVEVYGNVQGEIDESSSLQYSGNAYADSKINAEKRCLQGFRDGLPIVILRPSVVYGPFSSNWTVRVAERLNSGRWAAIQGLEGICNPVYVDDVVNSVLLALQREGIEGEAFNVSSGETVSWADYFEAFNRALGRTPLRRESLVRAKARALMTWPLRTTGKKAMETHRDLVMKAYSRWALAKALARWAEKIVKTSPTFPELRLYRRPAVYSINKAKEELGFSPSWSLEAGLQMASAWLRHNRYVPDPDAEAFD